MPLFHRYDTVQMIKACNEQPLTVLTSEGGLFDKLYQLYTLEDTLGIDVQLVGFGLSAHTHFSEHCWVVDPCTLFSFDSCRGVGHATLVSKVIEPFIAYVLDRSPFLEPLDNGLSARSGMSSMSKAHDRTTSIGGRRRGAQSTVGRSSVP